MSEKEFAEFLSSPNAVGFYTVYSEGALKYIDSNPYIHVGKIMGNFITIYIHINDVDTVIKSLTPSLINIFPYALGLLGTTENEEAGITAVQNQTYLDLHGKDVLLAFIDTGIDYTNEIFKYEDGTTRIKAIWDQSLKGSFPQTYYFGAEYNEAEINEALSLEDPYSKVPHKDAVGHGTFLASVAGARTNDEYRGAAPEAEFIIVKLRKSNPYYLKRYLVPETEENVFDSVDLMLGIEYVLEKAAELGKPVSICIGVGGTLSGHDGLNVFESYLSLAAQRLGICITTAAGNESQAKHHMSGVVDKAENQSQIDIKVEENSGSFPVYIFNGISDRFSVSVKSPTGEIVNRIPAKSGTILETRLTLEKAIVVVEYYFPIAQSGSQLTVVKILNPTPGVWRINVYGDILLIGEYNAWLPLTTLISPGIEFSEPNPNYTVVSPATSLVSITAGGYDEKTGSLYVNSSWGPTRLPIITPDLVAPSLNVPGIFPDGQGTMSGTSVAAAITAAAAALLLEWGINREFDAIINTYRIKGYLIRGCQRNKNEQYPNHESGYGKLNLIQAFNSLKNN